MANGTAQWCNDIVVHCDQLLPPPYSSLPVELLQHVSISAAYWVSGGGDTPKETRCDASPTACPTAPSVPQA